MRVLIIKLGALGDIVYSSSVIKQIQQHHVDNVWLLTAPNNKRLFANWEGLNVMALERKGFTNTIKTVLWTRNMKFDRVYDLQSNDRTSLICALSGIPFRAGNHPRFPYTHHPEKTYTGECHAFDRLNMVIERSGLNKAAAKPWLPTSQTDKTFVDDWLKHNSIEQKKYVIFHAGSSLSNKQKRWPYFDKLAQTLTDKGLTIIWEGGKEDMEINQALSCTSGIDATCNFSIPQSIELGKKALFAVTNDSAPMHILSCAGIPVFGLFGPTNPKRTHAVGQESRVIFAGEKIPDSDKAFIPESLSKISVDTVLDRVNQEGLLNQF